MKTADELTRLFRSQGRKVTPQRQCIFRVLQGDVTHPSADVVYARARERDGDHLAQDRLPDAQRAGSPRRGDATRRGTGTTRFDPNVEVGHHHLVCRSCGKVRDLHADYSLPHRAYGCRAGIPARRGRGRLPRSMRGRVSSRSQIQAWQQAQSNRPAGLDLQATQITDNPQQQTKEEHQCRS